MGKSIWAIVVIILAGAGIWFYLNKDRSMPENVGRATATPAVSENAVPNQNTVGEVREFTITGGKFYFSPKTITVDKGDRVKITFKNIDGFHDLLIEGLNVGTKKGQSPAEESFEFTADKTGSFAYYCSVGEHRKNGMEGTLTVK